MVKSLQEAVTRYGPIQNGQWHHEADWMSTCVIPLDITANWLNSFTHSPVHHIYINKDAVNPLIDALNNIKNRGLLAELKTFDGCYMIRDVRGMPGHPSTHSYGLAVDLNASENKLGGPNKLSSEFIACWTDAGWIWGGTFHRVDPMHFQYCSGF